MALKHMQKVEAKSVRDLCSTRHIYDLAHYYGFNRQPSSYEFSSVEPWEDFGELVARTIASRAILATQYGSLQAESVSEILEALKIRSCLVPSGPRSFVGKADLVLCTPRQHPILIGIHCAEDTDLNDVAWTVSPIVSRLTDMMILNHTALGYITNNSVTRFISLSNQHACNGDQGVKLEHSLSITEPKSLMESHLAMCIMADENFATRDSINFVHEFELIPQVVPEPDIYPLSCLEEGTAGKMKWWVASRLNRQTYKINFDLIDDTQVFRTGSISMESSSDPNKGPALKCPVYIMHAVDEKTLRHEASIYEYLEGFPHLTTVPRRVIYGRILSDIHVLALEPFGRQLTKEDVVNDHSVIYRMRLALRNLHDLGLMHHNVKLEHFYLGCDGVVRLSHFSSTKLYRTLPPAARENEEAVLGSILRACY